MNTTLIGANGRLGGMLLRAATDAGLDWQGHAHTAARTDASRSGQTAASDPFGIFSPGATVINMAGATAGTAQALTQANVSFVDTLLERAMRGGVAHVVLASSAAVYGAGHGTPFNETDPLRPLTPYGESKVQMELLAARVAEKPHAPAITIARIANVAGADALLAAATARAETKTAMDLHVFRDGPNAESAALRSYIGPRDLFNVMRAICDTPAQGLRVLNVAAPEPVFLDAVVTAYKTHLLPDLTVKKAPAPKGIPAQVTLDTKRIQTLVPFAQTADYADDMAAQVAADRAR